jgi:hypothetical protein
MADAYADAYDAICLLHRVYDEQPTNERWDELQALLREYKAAGGEQASAAHDYTAQVAEAADIRSLW